MNDSSRHLASLAGFSGRVPLFPLPNVVFLPHVLLPLHIFEPRYRQMTADALAGDRLIAMAQPQPGWETLRAEEPWPIYEYVCIGCITAAEELPDGRYTLFLQGLARARVLREEPTALPYRIAQVEQRSDVISPSDNLDSERRRREILGCFRELFPRLGLDELFHEIPDASASLGAVCDIVAASLRPSPEWSQELLAEDNVDRRSEIVFARLQELRRKAQAAPRRSTFPPDFSAN